MLMEHSSLLLVLVGFRKPAQGVVWWGRDDFWLRSVNVQGVNPLLVVFRSHATKGNWMQVLVVILVGQEQYVVARTSDSLAFNEFGP